MSLVAGAAPLRTKGRWERLGRILDGPGAVSWAVSHAALPYAEDLGDGRVRIYFCARDRENCARIGFVDVDPDTWRPVGPVSPAPVLDIGARGAFDDHGVTSSWMVLHEGLCYHYYSGWTIGRTVPFYFFAGLAVARPGEPWRRVSDAPLLDRCAVDPFLTGSPCVIVDGRRWRMWYVSGTGWTSDEQARQPMYHIKYAESADGITWDRRGVVSLDFADSSETAIARPCVVRDSNGYGMWFCHRGRAYKIGYAESADGLRWTRRDAEGGLEPSPAGWDSEMTAYPYVFVYRGDTYLLYNGNGYGRTGFGIARWA